MPRIVVHYSNGRTDDRPLIPGSHFVGREADCGVLVADPSISRHHARIFTDENGVYFVEDNGSKNGTTVNGEKIRRRRLADGDRISLGAVELVYSEGPGHEASTTVVVLGDEPVNMDAASFAAASQQLVLPQRRLERLYELSDQLTTLRDRGELLEDVMDICFKELEFERGLIALKHPRGQDPEWPVIRNLKEDAKGQLMISRTVVNQALVHGERCVINDPMTDMADPTVSIAEYHIRSAMCVPILYRDEILGVIYGDRITTSTRYDQNDVDFLAGLARHVAVGLVNYRLLKEHEEKLQLESELAYARTMQMGLYPKKPLVRDDLQVEGSNDASRLVSGDYYDVIEFEDGRVAVLIADVVGKGMAAALLTANLQAAVRMILPMAESLSDAVGRFNKHFHAMTDPSKFITALIGIVDPRTRRFEYVSAGHDAPLLLDASGALTEMPIEACFPLGVSATENYVAQSTELPAGAMFLLYTDGVTEAMRDDGEQYNQRLLDVLEGQRDVTPAELIRSVRTDLRAFVGNAPQTDDITLLAVRCP